MDRDEIEGMANAIQKRQSDIQASDTLENEARLVALMRSKGAIVKRGRQKGPQRYTVIMPNGRVGPVTLFEIESIWRKISGEKA
ncbi:hypothetical protein [Parvibaculum sp.]|uniref:hypothetical protein n=1 Tax=Parvibaculum sp. TaxID=2024848 RepID=UPI001D347DCD|nr:hypothetical protein [Parvibaculum sp.]MBX3488573.1 hypothetical protein [Parvibaculum sp.]